MSIPVVNAVELYEGSTSPPIINKETDNEVIANTSFVQGVKELVATVTKTMTGVFNSEVIGFSYDGATREFTVTLSDDLIVYQKGVKYVFTSDLSITLPNTEGNKYIYINEGSLEYSDTFSEDVILTKVYIANIYIIPSLNSHVFIGHEYHNVTRHPMTHLYLHRTVGASYRSGFLLSGFNVDGDGSSNTHAQFVADSGSFADEDILFQYTSTTQIPILYKTGANLWRIKSADSYPCIYNGTAGYSGTRIPYNRLNLGVYSLQEVQEGYYIAVHYFAINDTDLKVVGILGTAEYSTVKAARAGIEVEILSISGIPMEEFVLLGSVLFQSSTSYSNTPKARVVTIDDLGNFYKDYRLQRSLSISGAIGEVQSHSLLNDLDSDDHLQYHNDARGDARYFPKRTITGTTGRISITDGDGALANPVIDIGSRVLNYQSSHRASATGTTTTTSGTYVLMGAMTLTPPSGDYLLDFFTAVSNSNNSRTIWVSIYVGGTQVSGSEVEIGLPTANYVVPVSIVGFPISPNGSQDVEIRWRRSNSTGTAYNRNMILKKVG